MALRNILTDKDSFLRKTSREVVDFDERIHTLLDDMRDTLLVANGVGLAAPQVGILRRAVLVMDIRRQGLTPGQKIIELLNPEIIAQEGEQEGYEGCLSIPGKIGIVKRPMWVKVRAVDRNGKPFETEGRGMTARAMCHELDHLDGVLYTDIAFQVMDESELELQEESDAAADEADESI